jgi:hypothetical protein
MHLHLHNASSFTIGRARTATGQLLAVALVAATLSVAAFGFSTSPGNPIRGGALAPTALHDIVSMRQLDTSSPAIGGISTSPGRSMRPGPVAQEMEHGGPLRPRAGAFLRIREINGESPVKDHAAEIDVL